ncbi:MAG: NSFL1 cofactor p47-related protein [Amphiamblys sp. WSBS2006]|nr:MAG: NSFL1 cofactor p47-related protein [Amphiamblys sp. WSBS2006]
MANGSSNVFYFGDRSDSEEEDEHYSGGRKSGIAVQDTTPERIVRMAQESQPEGSPAQHLRRLVFWENGFTLDDGMLRPYETPESREFLEKIQKGVFEDDSVGRMDSVDLQVIDKKSTKYKEKKSKFEGTGRKLAEDTSEKINKRKLNTEKREIDPDRPSTTVPVRFTDGTKALLRFNTDESVQAVFECIEQIVGQEVDLFFGFPPKRLERTDRSIKEERLENTTVIQRFK